MYTSDKKSTFLLGCHQTLACMTTYMPTLHQQVIQTLAGDTRILTEWEIPVKCIM